MKPNKHLEKDLGVMKKIFLSFLLLFFLHYGYGQVSQGGIPYSLQTDSKMPNVNKYENLRSKEIPIFNMPLTVNITFSSPGKEISNAYTIFVNYCSKQKSATISNISDTSKINYPIQEESNDKFDFTVYPNPNDGNFIIELLKADEMKPYSVQIFNSLGSLVTQIEHCNTFQINVNRTDLPSGVYYVKLSIGNNIEIKKVIIQ